MTAQPIAPVIPSLAAWLGPRAPGGAVRPLPLAGAGRRPVRSGGRGLRDRVLLAAVPGQDMLAAYSFAVVDQAIRAHGAFPHAPGGQP